MNRLAHASSPYLQQHADNPVDWYVWDEEALELARREDKPILLSIGYSACHWCHVMAHESFEDPATAAVMNEHFVNIKVDREERPDLDKIYQLAHQVITRRGGGWPLTMFLDPQTHLPFFGGTYFPKIPRFQLPAFADLLRRIADYFQHNRADLRGDSESLRQILLAHGHAPGGQAPDAQTEARSCRDMQAEFDPVHGGFGGAPKFPHAAELEFLLGQWIIAGDREALHIVAASLEKMAEGGIYDQIGGGFCRYSVDAAWQIPHFEKMLYDNAVLLGLYARAWQATANPLFRRVAVETAEWVMREMQASGGGFYSSLDADSEGHEGKYYVWDRKEVRALLEPEEYAVAEAHYGLDQTPNFEGRWHCHVSRRLPEVAAALGVDLETAATRLASARAKLYAARERRVRPGLDDKVLTAWNGLMIEALAVAGRLLERPDFVAAAERSYRFLLATCADGTGRLLAAGKDGQAHLNAYLDDYAFVLNAGLELLECRWNSAELHRLLALAERLLEGFEDRERGGFFFTSADHEALIHRPKSWMDESMPSGNGMAALALLRLGELAGDARHTAAAGRTLHAAAGSLQRFPGSHGALLLALAEWLHPAGLVVVRGRPEALPEWIRAARRGPASGKPRRVFAIPNGETGLPGLLAERREEAGEVAYVCEGMSCRAPVRDLAGLKE